MPKVFYIWKISAFLIVAFLTLSGCGGDSSSATPSPAPLINQAPTVSIDSHGEYQSGQAVVISATASDADGTVTAFLWVQSSGPTIELNSDSGSTVEFIAPDVSQSSAVSLQVSVTDNDGATAIASTDVVIIPVPNIPPDITAPTAIEVTAEEIVTFDVSATDDGQIVSVLWEQLSGPAVSLTNAEVLTASFVAPTVEESTVLTFRLTVTDDKAATDSVEINVTVRPRTVVDIKVIIPDDIKNDVVLVTSGYWGDLALDENSQTSVSAKDSAAPTLVIALTASDDVRLMGFAKDNQLENITLSGITTLESLFYMVSDLREYIESANNFDTELATLPEVVAAADFINTNSTWSIDSNNESEQIIAGAIDAAMEYMNANPIDSDTAEKLKLSYEKSVSAFNNDKKQADSFFIGDGRGSISSGILPTYVAEQFNSRLSLYPATSGQGFSFSFSNENWGKTLIGLVTNDPNREEEINLNDKNVIVANSRGFLSRSGDFTFTESSPFEPLGPNNDRYGLYLYGFSIGDYENRPTKGLSAQAYKVALAQSLVLDYAAPILRVATPYFDCFRSLYETTISGPSGPKLVLSQFALDLAVDELDNPLLQQAFTRAYIDELAIEFAPKFYERTLISNAIENLSCIPDDFGNVSRFRRFLSKFGKVIGKFSKILDLTKLGIGLGKVSAEHSVGKSVQFFPINNEHNRIISISPIGTYTGIEPEQAAYLTDSELTQFTSDIAFKYSGDCIAEDSDNLPSTACHGLVYNSDPPYVVDFTVSCENKITTDPQVPEYCGYAEVTHHHINDEIPTEPTLVTDFSNRTIEGDLKFSLSFDTDGEHQGFIDVFDSEGGTSNRHHFALQIKRTQPWVVVTNTGNSFELDGSISNETLIISKPQEFSFNGSQYKLFIRLANLGHASSTYTLSIDGSTRVEIGPYTNYLEPLSAVESGQTSSTTTIELRVSEGFQTLENNVRLIVSGNLSTANAILPNQQTYSTIEIPIQLPPQVLTYDSQLTTTITSKSVGDSDCDFDDEPVGKVESITAVLILDEGRGQATLQLDIEGDGDIVDISGDYDKSTGSISLTNKFSDGSDSFNLLVTEQIQDSIKVIGTAKTVDQVNNGGTCSVDYDVVVEGVLRSGD